MIGWYFLLWLLGLVRHVLRIFSVLLNSDFSVFGVIIKNAKNFDKRGWWNRTRHKDCIRPCEKKVRARVKKVLDNFHDTSQSFHKVLLFFNKNIRFYHKLNLIFWRKTGRFLHFLSKIGQISVFLTSRECNISDQRWARLILSENWSQKMRNILTKSASFEIEWGDKCSKYLECSG